MQKKIICLFDYKANTGYGTVTRNIVPIIKEYFGDKIHLDIVGINYFGRNQKGIEDLKFNEDKNTTVYSAKFYDANKRSNPTDDFGRDLFCKLCFENNYDGMFIMQDIGVVSAMMNTLRPIYSRKIAPKSIFYFPIDADCYPKELYNGITWFDKLITYTEWGKSVVLKSVPSIESKLSVIPHGINDTEFYPLSEAEKSNFRESYFGKENAQKFIIGNINRNQPRKDIPTTILGFEMYKKDWLKEKKGREPFLYLHMNPKDPLGNDLYFLMKQTSLVEGVDYMFPKVGFEPHVCNVENLNKIYNSLDLYVTTAMGGGWELPVYEAMAAKVPIIVPNHTCFTHIVDKAAVQVSPKTELFVGADNIIRYKTNLKSLYNFFYVHTNGELFEYTKSVKKQFVLSGYEYTQQLQWRNIGKKWCEVFAETFKI